jgi:hypothetical protein
MGAGVLAGLAGRAERLGEAQVARRLARLEDRAREAFPEAEVRREGDRLVMPGLGRRARGSRHRAPDPRLAMLAAWLAMED